MANSEDRLIVKVVIIAIILIFIFTAVVIVFFSIYRKRLHQEQRLQQEKERAYQKDLLTASINSQDNERMRIARELHDDIGAMLTTTKVYFDQFSSDLSPEDSDRVTQNVNHLLANMIDSTRSISQNLRPVILEKLGLTEGLDSLLKTISETGKIQTRFTFNCIPELSKEKGLNMYRIVQELIANTFKHAKASSLHLDLDVHEDSLILSYSDNGQGIQNELISKKGIGRKNIESRVSIVEGKITYSTNQNDSGLRVVIIIPL